MSPTRKKSTPRRGAKARRGSKADPRHLLVPTVCLVALALGLTLVLSLIQGGSPQAHSPEMPQGEVSTDGTPAPTEVLPEVAPPQDQAPLAEAPDQEGLVARAASLAQEDDTPQGTDAPQGAYKPPSARTVARPPRPEGRKPIKPKPTLIFVIDDAGHNLGQLEAFLKLPFPLTIAVLPGLPHSAEAAKAVRAAGKELILHQPMEALGGQDPGPGAIRLGMTPSQARALVRANLDSLPGARGLNNHEGSAVSQRTDLMAAVLGVAKSRGIYYLDSLTVGDSVVQALAPREGIRLWERDVFLDNSPDRVSIVHYIDVGKKKAEKSGAAIMIGHVWSAELAQTLAELYPGLVAEGFSLSTISKVMLEEADANSGD